MLTLETMTYEVTGRIARITLNRPARGNGITFAMPRELADCVERADLDPAVHVMVLAGNGAGFCGGYDLVASAERNMRDLAPAPAPAPAPAFWHGSPMDPLVQAQNHTPGETWDPTVDYAMMSRNVRGFMSLFFANKPVVCKVHGFCVAGGTDMALCSDLLVVEDAAKLGYPPARVWGVPTTALWAYRVGVARAKRLLFTGDSISGTQAVEWGLAAEAPPAREARRGDRGARRAHRARAGEPARHDEAPAEPDHPRAGAPRGAGARDAARRRRAPHEGGLRIPAARDGGGLQAGRPRARRSVRRRGAEDVGAVKQDVRPVNENAPPASPRPSPGANRALPSSVGIVAAGCFVAYVGLLVATACTSSGGGDAGAATCTTLFGAPNQYTGLGPDQCQPQCGCGADAFVPPAYDDAFIQSLVDGYQLATPYPPLPSNPYDAPPPQADPDGTVCAVLEQGDPSASPRPYTLVTYPSADAATTAGAHVTHFGHCGVCSTLANLAVYMRNSDLTAPVRACGLQSGTGSGTASDAASDA
ncbi:MAG TPA: crotonase/enoyl-CoA hydratase family protein, partial [Polyangiaceae bacterium]